MVHEALDVPALRQTGVSVAQSPPEDEPALPRHTGVTHAPLVVLQTRPPLHWPSLVQPRTRVPALATPALVALTARLPTGRSDMGTQLQVPAIPTRVVHTDMVLTLTVTDWPGTPVPVRAGRTSVVVAVPSAGGLVSATLGATQAKLAVL